MAIQSINGTLISIGGNEDKGIKPKTLKNFLGKGILNHVLRESGGPNAKMVIIPTASRIPEEVGQNYIDAFKLLGCNNVTVLDIRRRGLIIGQHHDVFSGIAADARVNQYIHFVLSEESAEVRDAFRQGLTWFDTTSRKLFGKDFLELAHSSCLVITKLST